MKALRLQLKGSVPEPTAKKDFINQCIMLLKIVIFCMGQRKEDTMSTITKISFGQVADDLYCIRIWRNGEMLPRLYYASGKRAKVFNDLANIRIGATRGAYITTHMFRGELTAFFNF